MGLVVNFQWDDCYQLILVIIIMMLLKQKWKKF